MTHVEFYSEIRRLCNLIKNTDYKTFNKQTTLISYGNVIASTQYSNHIRVNEGEEIFNYDLQGFNLNRHAKALTKTIANNFYLYQFHIYNHKAKKHETIGWLFMSEDNLKCYYSIVNGDKYYSKKASVLNACEQVIIEDRKLANNYKNEL